MADSTRVDRVLAVTRQSFRAPLDARERVRAGLHDPPAARAGRASEQPGKMGGDGDDAAGGLLPTARTGAAGVARSTAALLSGLTFIAGFWLGGATSEREQTPSVQTVISMPAAHTAPAPSAVSTAVPSVVAPQAESLTAGGQPAPVASSPSADPASPRAGAAPPEREGARRAPRATRPRATARDGTPGDGASVARASRVRTSGEELALLRRAEHAIRSGQPDLALSLLDELEQRYPETRLDEERMAARLMARCARADVDASAEAARFLKNRPASVYSERVRSGCGLAPDGDAPDRDDAAGN